jgi:hypothetical protein
VELTTAGVEDSSVTASGAADSDGVETAGSSVTDETGSVSGASTGLLVAVAVAEGLSTSGADVLGAEAGSGSVELTTAGVEDSSVAASGLDVGDVSTGSTGGGSLATGSSAAELSLAADTVSGALSPEAGLLTDPHVNTNRTDRSSITAMTAPLAGVDSGRMGRGDAAARSVPITGGFFR